MEQIYIKMEKTLGVSFKKHATLEFLNNLANCLLIKDDSFKEIYSVKEFLNWPLQTSQNIKVIYKRRNFYQQSKSSRTIDLNTTHIILFKSARD